MVCIQWFFYLLNKPAQHVAFIPSHSPFKSLIVMSVYKRMHKSWYKICVNCITVELTMLYLNSIRLEFSMHVWGCVHVMVLVMGHINDEILGTWMYYIAYKSIHGPKVKIPFTQCIVCGIVSRTDIDRSYMKLFLVWNWNLIFKLSRNRIVFVTLVMRSNVMRYLSHYVHVVGW